ncbi:hypothetical protein D0865_06359 [Hortaea werneckii]|uniref:Disease resistance R13L4/SHOC-2-like LRR domain-containing protein n=1 Tax=Hortaea werneckii TaxID=91943 RepID=A0A3M7CH84_HORWE|nr:hypothetical protein D0865_06359 [Hortaea werneckii]
MATEAVATKHEKSSMTVSQLVEYTKQELDADAERQAKVSATGTGGLESQTGATLDLSHKNINALPVEVIALIKDKVERLALSHNPQIAVPSQIVQCNRLRYLNIRWNKLRHFPEAILQLSALEILDLSKNNIDAIPEEIRNMSSLKFLAVAKNKITRLPFALGEMPSLSKLKFDENPIEFPPPDVLKPIQDHIAVSIESEKEVCQQVKRFLKAAGVREKMRSHSEDDARYDLEVGSAYSKRTERLRSESNADTPRPPKRMASGRFPIRPSVSGIENVENLKTRSPNGPPPPIPQRSHARNLSSNAPSVRRPGIAPLLNGGNDISRSRSETISSSASIRSRRQGFVPSKTRLGSNAVSEAGDQRTGRLSNSISRPSHSRATSSVSTLNGFLAPGSGGDSSGAVSPVGGARSRDSSVRRLSSLPEDRNSKIETSDAYRAAKRLLFSLFQLHGPISEVSRGVKDSTPKRPFLERQLFSANAHVEELDRLLNKLDGTFENGTRGEEQSLRPAVYAAVAALRAYGSAVRELRQQSRKAVSATDPLFVRCLMSQIYMTMVECRNICNLLGFKAKTPSVKDTPRVSKAWSSRTVTPTQPSKPINNRRLRGATILQNMGEGTSIRPTPPPISLSANSSRSNTMTSMSATTPRSRESFGTLPTSTFPSRSNTIRSNHNFPNNTLSSDVEENNTHNILNQNINLDDHFDRIYTKLRHASELAAHSLPHCRTEFTLRKDSAETVGQMRAAHHWGLALAKCEVVITTNNALLTRLRDLRNNPEIDTRLVRSQRDFWLLCDAFVQSWADLATEVKDLAGSLGLDLNGVGGGVVKSVMRPVQRGVKEVSKAVSESPIYLQAVGRHHQQNHHQHQQQFPAMSGVTGAPYPSFTLNGSGGGFYSPSSINTAFAQQQALGGRGDYTPTTTSGSSGRSPSSQSFFSSDSQPDPGYVTPVVPATPLSAALGPAVQATVASSENGNGASNGPLQQSQQQDYFPQQQQQQYTTQYRPEWGAQRAHERMDHAFNSGSAATAGNGGYGRR